MRRMDAYEENKRDHLMERGGKFGADVGINRRPLRNIENFVPAVPHSHAMSGTGSHRNPLKEKNTSNRPWTRQIAEPQKSDQTSSLDPIAGKENLTKENSVHDHMPAESTMQIIEEMEEMINADLEEVEMEDAVVDRALDIDKEDADDPLAVADYAKDIYVSYRETEAAAGVRPDYMSDQIDINERMRGILIDWLIEVHYKFDLMEETLFLTVNIIDRFLARETVMRKKLQLVGVTAMLIACKYEEVSPPVVEDLIIISDRAYTRAEVLEMERQMLNALEFNMSAPTPYVFMRRFLRAAASEKQLELLSFFVVELCLVEYEMLRFPPSLLAAAAVYTAQCSARGFRLWTRASELYSSYSEDHLLECSRKMVGFHQRAATGRLTSVHRKYSTFKYGYAASSDPPSFLLE